MTIESSDKVKDLQSAFDPEYLSRIFDFWSDVLKLPTIGPLYAFSKDVGSYANDFINLGKIMTELKKNMDGYWAVMGDAYLRAATETARNSPKQLASKDDVEAYRRAMINAFEDSFTSTFASPEFSAIYGKLFSAQLEMSKTMQAIAEKNLKMLNLPTRSEVDEILKDIAELRRTVRNLKKDMEMVLSYDQARNGTI